MSAESEWDAKIQYFVFVELVALSYTCNTTLETRLCWWHVQLVQFCACSCLSCVYSVARWISVNLAWSHRVARLFGMSLPTSCVVHLLWLHQGVVPSLHVVLLSSANYRSKCIVFPGFEGKFNMSITLWHSKEKSHNQETSLLFSVLVMSY